MVAAFAVAPAAIATTTPASRERMILQYTPLVRHIVNRLGVARNGVLDADDLVSAGMVGLVEAADRFDPDAGVKFETFAYMRIRGAVLDQVRSLDWVPRSVRKHNQTLAAVRARLEGEHGRSPSETEMAGALGLDLIQFRATHSAAPSPILSLDASSHAGDDGGGGDDGAPALADLVPSGGENDPVLAVETAERHQALLLGLRALSERDRVLLSLYYERDLTMKEIGVVLGISEPRVCQLHGRAVQRLRAGLAEPAGVGLGEVAAGHAGTRLPGGKR